ncbi:hypothetical protein LTR85_002044 [Meristemomyces frigidus]|nr:hypothetical protein LTR85_002044 [Meristemomyces frigidus]
MSLQASLPWTKSPLIINAPMAGFATAPLATAVTHAGGLGFIGSALDMSALSDELTAASQALPRQPNGLLPLGVGLLTFIADPEKALPILAKFKPAVVWLFAAKELSDYSTWTQKVRAATPKSQIWIQVGSVAAALTVASQCKPDALCIQGIDAGGHGFSSGAGIISLLPEVADALAAAGHSSIPLVAAGGISCGRSAAAAFTLGAQGIVMGTRFLSASETHMPHPGYRQAVLSASDGGQTTTRAKLFDELRGPSIWPGAYDGRSIVMESFTDHAAGVEIGEVRQLHAEALKTEGGGFGVDGKGRAVVWAGTGVGLVKKEQAAGEIVGEVRREVVETLEKVRSRL